MRLELAYPLSSLAEIRLAARDYAQAEALYTRATKIRGREPVYLHPETAGRFGLAAGDVALLSNARGTALAGVVQRDDELLGESADLLFHLIVLLRARGLSLDDAVAVLEQRHARAAEKAAR